MLFSAHTASMAATFFATAVQLRWMDPAERGIFALALPIVTLSALVLEFGAFPAGARLLALERDSRGESRALGALALVGIALGAALTLFLLIAAFPLEMFFKKDIGWILMSAAPVAFFLPFQSLVQSACQGLNQITRLSAFQFSQSLLNLIFQASLASANYLTARTALVAQLSAIALASLWAILRMRPSFKERARYLKMIFQEVRNYGFNIYLARITGTASTQIDNVMIGYFVADPVPLSLYDGAQRLSNPIITLARSLAITRFRAFASLSSVSPRISRWNAGLLIASSLMLALAGPFALAFIFPKYTEAAPLLIPFAVWGLFGGLFQPYHMFLNAHGRGSEIRNIAMVTMAASVTGLLISVPRWGIAGAAWSSAAAMALDWAATLYYYRKFKRTLSSASETTTL